jgi:hypothetical protein
LLLYLLLTAFQLGIAEIRVSKIATQEKGKGKPPI